MKYEICNDCLKIYGKEDFNPKQILECGQVFSYDKVGENYIVFPQNKFAEIIETEYGYDIKTDSPIFFEHYFDLKTNYFEIKSKLSKFAVLNAPIEYGKGIRILKQDVFETIISFIISANNNISRIRNSLKMIRQKAGKNMGKFYSFPDLNSLKKLTVEDFRTAGTGYRAEYLYEAIRQLGKLDLNGTFSLSTNQLIPMLLQLKGVGPKVADCILLFGYGKTDVFPVDTWIAKVYADFFDDETNRKKIRENLLNTFGELSGYAQQYLFYYKREN